MFMLLVPARRDSFENVFELNPDSGCCDQSSCQPFTAIGESGEKFDEILAGANPGLLKLSPAQLHYELMRPN
jgi:hypothetical protein